MFQSVADVLSWKDMEMPIVSHPGAFEDWKDSADSVLGDVLKSSEIALTQKEEASLEVAKEVGFGILERFLSHARSVGWSSQSPEERRAAVEALLLLPQIPQRTPAWYAQGKEVLTASEFSTLFGSPRAWSQLVLSKVPVVTPVSSESPQTHRLACLSCEMTPFDWGVRFEPVVKQILTERWGVDIKDSGRLLHPTDHHLAASPDGLILSATDSSRVGRLVEIKCPISRRIGEGVPFEYWCQMQIQMEVTGIGECEYVEVKIESLHKTQTDLSGGAPEGYVWVLQEPTTCQMTYAYTEAEKEEKEAAGWDLLETVPWRVAGLYTKTVARDRAWFQGTQALRTQFWKDVEQARAGLWKAPEPARPRRTATTNTTVIVQKEGAPPPTECLILDEEPSPEPTPFQKPLDASQCDVQTPSL